MHRNTSNDNTTFENGEITYDSIIYYFTVWPPFAKFAFAINWFTSLSSFRSSFRKRHNANNACLICSFSCLVVLCGASENTNQSGGTRAVRFLSAFSWPFSKNPGTRTLRWPRYYLSSCNFFDSEVL